MPRIRLSEHPKPFPPVSDALGRPVDLNLSRWKCPVLIGSGDRAALRQGLVDTGSSLSVIPERTWSHPEFPREQVRWLNGPPEGLPPLLILGGTYRYRLGVVSLQPAQDDLKSFLSPTDTIAQFTDDGGRLTNIVLGLRHGILDGRRLALGSPAVLEDPPRRRRRQSVS